MSTALDSVIRRIQKLLAKTEDRGATEEEADTAMKMVQELMLQHNLDMATIEAAGQSHEDTGSVRVKEEFGGKARFEWQRILAQYVAYANFCHHGLQRLRKWVPGYYERDGQVITDEDADENGYDEYIGGRYKALPARHVFVGRKANVVTAQLMFQYLSDRVEELVPIQDKSERFSRFANSWKLGCAHRLCDRLMVRKDELVKQHDARVREAQKAAEEAARKEEAQRLAAHNYTTQERESALKTGAVDASGCGASYDPNVVDMPAPDDSGWRPGSAVVATTVAEAPTTTNALVLASVFDKAEQDANWEMLYDLAPGTMAARRAACAREQAKEATELAEQAQQQETDQQRKRREREEKKAVEKERRRLERNRETHKRRQQREWAKRDHDAYQMGAEKANAIGLDPQVGAGTNLPKLPSNVRQK